MDVVFLLALLIHPQAPVAPPALPVLIDDTRPPYDDARQKAIAEGKPLVVCVGRPRLMSGNFVLTGARRGAFSAYPETCVIVARPVDGDLVWVATLAADASDAEIREALRPRVQTVPLVRYPAMQYTPR